MTTFLERVKKERDKAQQDYDDALKRLKTWTEALKLLQPEEVQSEGNGPTHEKGELTIGDYVKQILEEFGPQRCTQIHKRVLEKGRETSVNSINVHLNRYKGKRYYKTGDEKWHLRSKQEVTGRLIGIPKE